MTLPHAIVIPVLAASLLLLEPPPAARAIDRQYSILTSTPSGRAVCSIEGTVTNAQLGDELEVTLTPATGQEAKLTIELAGGPQGTTAAGVEESCDIFD